MISKETVWKKIWPTVEQLIEATLAEDKEAIASCLWPAGEAATLHELFGATVFDILLKTVLGREKLAITRAIETENGTYVHIEYVWPDPEAEDGGYTAADVVSVQLGRHGPTWRVISINPAAVDVPLTEARAQGILLRSGALANNGAVPQEPWILPVALFGGNLQLPIRPEAMTDSVELHLLPGLQHRSYGVLSLLSGRRLWRDYKEHVGSDVDNPAAWAAAVEFIINEQTMREMTQAAVGKHYQVGMAAILPRIRKIKETLQIKGLDERYTSLHRTQIVLKEDDE